LIQPAEERALFIDAEQTLRVQLEEATTLDSWDATSLDAMRWRAIFRCRVPLAAGDRDWIFFTRSYRRSPRTSFTQLIAAASDSDESMVAAERVSREDASDR
jgi:hypothetical protein